ncbi:hypothetical protein H6F75_14745 [Nodosilinea sp. FACHB-131]|uniref:hypothetical protein n=1 Tax=Cyanophyceae TaxID=3028117 RepID=UPI0016856514|nr:hypothetical protein [Nodosilinea sp. FACHB-131]MBD1874744.1 hypothetical protein [Nodosilinea sp. FACHB-131]
MPTQRHWGDTPTVVQAAPRATEQLYEPGYQYYKAGVMLMELDPTSIAQGSLFVDESRRETAWQLMDAVDSLS